MKRSEVLARIDELGEASPHRGITKGVTRAIDAMVAAISAG